MRTWTLEDGGGALWLCVDGRQIADIMPSEPDDDADEMGAFIAAACNAAEQRAAFVSHMGDALTRGWDAAQEQRLRSLAGGLTHDPCP